MSAIRLRVTTAAGLVVTGPVQGSGGYVGGGCSDERAPGEALRRMQLAIVRANEGEPLRTVLEIEPGCALMFPEHSHRGNGARAIVPLRGASVELDS